MCHLLYVYRGDKKYAEEKMKQINDAYAILTSSTSSSYNTSSYSSSSNSKSYTQQNYYDYDFTRSYEAIKREYEARRRVRDEEKKKRDEQFSLIMKTLLGLLFGIFIGNFIMLLLTWIPGVVESFSSGEVAVAWISIISGIILITFLVIGAVMIWRLIKISFKK